MDEPGSTEKARKVKGSTVVNVSVEVAGPGAERVARELRADLASEVPPPDRVGPVEVERSADLVVAIIGLVFSGASTAATLWDWWSPRRTEDATVAILLPDGARLDLAGLSREQLEQELERRNELE